MLNLTTKVRIMYEANNIIIYGFTIFRSINRCCRARARYKENSVYILDALCVKNEKMINVQFELQSNDMAARRRITWCLAGYMGLMCAPQRII